MIDELSDHLLNRWFFFFCKECFQIMKINMHKIKNLLLWIIFFPLSLLGGFLSIRLYDVFSPSLEDVGGILAVPQISSFFFSAVSVCIFFLVFIAIAVKLIPSSAQVKLLVVYLLVLLMSCGMFVFRIYTSRFYPLGSFVALFLIAAFLFVFMFLKNGFRSLWKDLGSYSSISQEK